ncbi:MAG: TonB-dependent receptor plug domain-containing protein [Bacteroidota bacterium]|nr:TonB-dependent receptor plug domain-containing protein [Bacteroidota bacterium]MDP3144154.1 TonB-dependent receptor plug domain-containing protein [Bacteroidota bacterium]MDP3558259.1 TonB-dependent receptor plug domain-containing protein [Bacteroidota bacterium]
MKTINLKIAAITILLIASALKANSQGYGEIRGIIKNTSLEPVPFATVKILQGNILIGGAQTDVEGKYKYKPLNPGTYDIIVMESGHITQPVNKIKVIPNEATYVDVKISANTLTTVTVTAKAYDYTKSGVDKTMYTMKSLDATELLQLAGSSRGDIKGVLTSITSDVIETNGEMHFRGSRGGANGYFVDGVRTLDANTIPGLGIENLTVFSGGVPAMYGDVMGGVVIITTKSYFSGIREKNMRHIARQEKYNEQKRIEKAKLDEENRLKEIEEEKKKEAEG